MQTIRSLPLKLLLLFATMSLFAATPGVGMADDARVSCLPGMSFQTNDIHVSVGGDGDGFWAEEFWTHPKNAAAEDALAALDTGSEFSISERFFVDLMPWHYPETTPACGEDEDCAMTPLQVVHLYAPEADSLLRHIVFRSEADTVVMRENGEDILRITSEPQQPVLEAGAVLSGSVFWVSARYRKAIVSTPASRKELARKTSALLEKCN